MEPTPNTCALCAGPLSLGSVDGVCPVCLRTQRFPQQGGETLRPAATVGPWVNIQFTRDTGAEVPLPPNPPELALLRRLGTGGMGTVYLAVDAQTRRLVAVKLLHSPSERGSIDRFQAEVRALAELDHPHIVTVFTADLNHHTPYYTMEFVPGGTLSRFVHSRGQRAARDAVALLVPIARAAHAAHERGIVHRDIKPGNVLLVNTEHGTPRAEPQTAEDAPSCLDTALHAPHSALRAKLSDFGLVKRTNRNDALTVGFVAVGTPGFMAPEQAARGEITPRTDVYGLGATLFYALTGRPPFEGDPRDIIRRLQETDARRLRSLSPEMPVALEAIVQKCLERDPAARYASAAELAADLERFAAGQCVVAKPLTPVRRAARAVSQNRHRLTRIAVALAAIVVAVLVGAAISNRPRVEQEKRPPTPLEEMQAKLSAGETVTLVGMTGEPAWHHWAQGAGGFGVAGNRDQACMFQALSVSMLDLCPDPMTDRYRLRAEISQLDVQGRAQDGQLPNGGIHQFGVYFGRQTVTGNDGWRAENFFAVRFSEVKKLAGPEQARFERVVVMEAPKREPGVSRRGLGSVPLVQSGTLPGPWRVIEVEVTPQSVKAWIGSLDSAPLAFEEQNTAVLGRTFTTRLSALDKVVPNHGIVFADWSVRAPIGIWSERSGIAVRNVTLTPLK